MTQIALNQRSPADAASEGLEQLRRSIRRFEGVFSSLPVATSATCPICRNVIPAVFDRKSEQIVLTYNCPDCGENTEVHADTIWSRGTGVSPVEVHGRDARATRSASPTHTLSDSPAEAPLRRLPRTVETLCPECCAVILGRYFVADGAVYTEKTCPEHGYFRDCISSDALLYSKSAWWTFEDSAVRCSPARSGKRCPSDCGLCEQHLSASCLAQIDLTNRCNMRCPICFANSGTAGYLFEPTFEQIVDQLRALREMEPTPATAVQFTGGEPTIHPDFLTIVSTAGQMGFSHIQVATNGLRFAEDGFALAAARAGVHTLYLQFDGVGEEPHRQTRNYPGIWEKKLACIENCRRAGLKICLVPTILKGVNDDHVGEIFRFAVSNIDVVSGISYQPISFSGRSDPSEVSARRYTLGDLAGDIAEASGAVGLRDMYPLSIVAPLGQFLQAITGDPKIRPSCHPDCAFGTYFMVSPDGQAFPFPQVVDVEGMFSDMNRLAGRIETKGRMTWLDKMAVFRMFKRHFRSESAPPGLDVKKFVRSLQGLVDKRLGRGEGEKHTYKTLLCAGMHFQDRYNYDIERVKRCIILYSTPEGIFPFCAYNCGPEYRAPVEKKHSIKRRTEKNAGPENT